VGELQVQTPATRERRVAPDVLDRLTDDGWFCTGDIGRVDDDGFVWIEGRVSDMINRGGMKVFPAQVEEALMSSPAVRDVAVVGVADERLGEVPWAFVVSAAGPVDTAELEAWCRDRLSPYKVPERFVAVASLPRNETGKVLRAELLALDTP
jgi:acyl-CoA synthetase (AMP-forming)/AMP-acid ligase II